MLLSASIVFHLVLLAVCQGAWAIFPGAQPTEQPQRDPGGGQGNDL